MRSNDTFCKNKFQPGTFNMKLGALSPPIPPIPPMVFFYKM